MVCELRNGKFFPTLATLLETTFKIARKVNKALKKTLKPKLLNICSIVQSESSYATPFIPCHCQHLLMSKLNDWDSSSTLLKVNKIDFLNNYHCFECVVKTICQHSSNGSDTYQFLHTHREYQCRPVLRNVL